MLVAAKFLNHRSKLTVISGNLRAVGVNYNASTNHAAIQAFSLTAISASTYCFLACLVEIKQICARPC
uniref:Uncharacterized protein n=1 Tax=Arundo donax TaxID=35708 RepID=A0A0A8Y390_ARUDO